MTSTNREKKRIAPSPPEADLALFGQEDPARRDRRNQIAHPIAHQVAQNTAMRILHVATHHGVYRGGAVQVCRMAATQRRRGHEVTVIGNLLKRGGARSSEGDLASWQPLVEAGVPFQAVDFSGLSGARRLRRLIQAGRFDILHAHRDEALVASWLATWRLDRPVLIAQRGTTSNPPRWAARAFRSRRVGRVVAVAEAVGKELASAVPGVAQKIRVVYGSVDLEAFSPRKPMLELRRELSIPDGARVIGSISAYRKAKGFDVLLDALGEVFREEQDVHAVFLGLGVAKRIEPLAVQRGLKDRCHFVGHRRDVADWISFMDLTVVSATKREGLSGVIRESLAMEVPVVSTDCSGNREIARDRETALLVPIEDSGALAQALRWALAHPEEMRTMAKAGRRWVQEHCAPDVQAEALERVYHEALESCPPPGPHPGATVST